MLHAAELGFVHPATEREVRWTLPMPPDMLARAGRASLGSIRPGVTGPCPGEGAAEAEEREGRAPSSSRHIAAAPAAAAGLRLGARIIPSATRTAPAAAAAAAPASTPAVAPASAAPAAAASAPAAPSAAAAARDGAVRTLRARIDAGVATLVPYSNAPTSFAVSRGTPDTGLTYSHSGVRGNEPADPSATPLPMAGEVACRW